MHNARISYPLGIVGGRALIELQLANGGSSLRGIGRQFSLTIVDVRPLTLEAVEGVGTGVALPNNHIVIIRTILMSGLSDWWRDCLPPEP